MIGGWTLCATAAAVVHECGHLLTCLVFKVKVQEFRIGRPDRSAFRFRFRGVTVWLGAPSGGQVRHDPVPSRQRSAAILASGSLANLVVAGLLLAVAVVTAPHQSETVGFPEHEAVELAMAVFIGATGLANLLPFRTRWGRLSDGAKLLALSSGRLGRKLRPDEIVLRGSNGETWRPATPQEEAEFQLDAAALKRAEEDPQAVLPPELVGKWLAAYRDRTFIGLATAAAVGRSLRKDGRIGELLELVQVFPAPQGRLARSLAHSAGALAYEVALVPGMPSAALDQAVDCLDRLLGLYETPRIQEEHASRAATLHSLAVARLRQGQPQVVEDLCRTALAGPELSPANRATVLATIVLARQALGHPYERLLAEATALDPRADLVAEAATRSRPAGGRTYPAR